MKEPGVVINAVRQLVEGLKILSAKVEFSFAAAEVKTVVGSELALGILAPVAFFRGTRRLHGYDKRRPGAVAKPEQSFAAFEHRRAASVWHRHVDLAAGLFESTIW